MLKLSVFWVILFCFCFHLNNFLEALNIGEEGVCVVKISLRKTRQKAVQTNKWCGKKKCIVKKIEHYTVPEDRAVCCKGYEYHVHTDQCSPICSTGCAGGRCSAPETCKCDPPAYLDMDQKNSCVIPPDDTNRRQDEDDHVITKFDEEFHAEVRTENNDMQDNHISKDALETNDDSNTKPNVEQECKYHCINSECINYTCVCHTGYDKYNETFCLERTCEHTCVNSKCINKTCICNEGYQKVNDSLCLKCDDGYKIIENDKCLPECKEDCVNGVCVNPDVCNCLPGYKLKNKYICEPICDCVKATCVVPNKCDCLEGYERYNESVCVPKCDCEGICVGPNICECPVGFTNDNSKCKPVCEDCGNGYCSAPSVCSCEEGFVRNDTDSGFSCVRRCDLPVTEDAKVPYLSMIRNPSWANPTRTWPFFYYAPTYY